MGQAQGGEGLIDLPPRPAAGGQVHQRQIHQLMQGESLASGQDVPCRQHRHQLLAEQQTAGHRLQGHLAGQADQGEIQLPLAHRRQQRLALVLAQPDVHLRMTGMEGGQQLDDIQAGHRGDQADRQGAANGADRGGHVLLRPFHRR